MLYQHLNSAPNREEEHKWLSSWVNVRSMERMTCQYLDVIWKIFLKRRNFRRLTRRLSTYNRTNLRRYNYPPTTSSGNTRSIGFHYFIHVLSLHRVKNEITPSRNKMSILHDVNRTSYPVNTAAYEGIFALEFLPYSIESFWSVTGIDSGELVCADVRGWGLPACFADQSGIHSAHVAQT